VLLSAFSGFFVMVQFLYSIVFPSLLTFFSSSLFSFLPFLSVSADREKISFETKTLEIFYVEIEMFNLIELQLKMMTLVFIE